MDTENTSYQNEFRRIKQEVTMVQLGEGQNSAFFMFKFNVLLTVIRDISVQ
jgi:hypothetical protein